TTALVWDLGGLRPRRIEDARAVATLWDDLGADDPARAYAAAFRAVAAGDTAVAVLKGKIKPLAPVDEAKVAEWLRQLDSPDFASREKASQVLAALGPAAEPFVAKMASETASPETRSRAARLLAGYSAGSRRPAWAVEVLGMIGTADAKQL